MNSRKFTAVCSTVVFCLTLLLPTHSVQAAPAMQADDAGDVVAAEAAAAKELLVFEVNRNVTKADHGFPSNTPPRAAANGNWVTPVNFAQGTFYYRLEIRSQPKPQRMRLQFCVWQYRYTLEICGWQRRVTGNAGTVITWSEPIQGMWRKNGKDIDWKNPRQRYGMAIKNAVGKPVSDYSGWNWNGENPNQWYPLNMRFTVVVVAKGATFSGWNKYIRGTAADTVDPAQTTPNLDPEWDGAPLDSPEANLSDPAYGSGLDAAFVPEDEVSPDDAEQTRRMYLPLVTNS